MDWISFRGGGYVLFLDPDDYLDNSAVEKMVAAAEKNRSELVVCDKNMRYENGKVKVRGYFPEFNSTTRVLSDDRYKYIFARTGAVTNKLFRQSEIGQMRFNTDFAYGEDYIFLFEYLAKTQSAVIVPEPLYQYTVGRENSATGTVRLNNRWLDFVDAVIWCYQHSGNNHKIRLVCANRLMTAIGFVSNKLVQCEKNDDLSYIQVAPFLRKIRSSIWTMCAEYIKINSTKVLVQTACLFIMPWLIWTTTKIRRRFR